MKLQEMSQDELELLSYTDLTYMLLKEEHKPMTTPVLFKKICDLLDYTDSEFESKIGDYYTSLTIDKRFVMVNGNEWDLRDHHSIEIILDEEDEEEVEVEEEEEVEVEDEENLDEALDDESLDDDVDDDIDDLSIVEEEDLEEE